MRSLAVLLFAASLIASAAAAKPVAKKLPKYIGKGCSRNDPNLNECVVRVGGPAIRRVAEGDPEYRIPQLDPFVIDSLTIGRGTQQVGLVLKCDKCTLYGLKETKLIKAKMDLNARTCKWFLHLDKLVVLGNYNVTGRVLLLPITGNGAANFTFRDVDFAYDYTWNYKTKSNGKEYVDIQKGSLTFDVKGMSIHLENLFNGDKLLGDNMNRFLNENWEEILKDVSPAITESVGLLMKTVLNAMADIVPYDNMFPK